MEGDMSKARLRALGLLPAPVLPEPKHPEPRVIPQPFCDWLYARFPVKPPWRRRVSKARRR